MLAAAGNSADLVVEAVLEQAHVGAQAVVCGRQLAADLRRQVVQVRGPQREVVPAWLRHPQSILTGHSPGHHSSKRESSCWEGQCPQVPTSVCLFPWEWWAVLLRSSKINKRLSSLSPMYWWAVLLIKLNNKNLTSVRWCKQTQAPVAGVLVGRVGLPQLPLRAVGHRDVHGVCHLPNRRTPSTLRPLRSQVPLDLRAASLHVSPRKHPSNYHVQQCQNP